LRLILGLIRTLDPGGIPSLLASKLRRLCRERP
jgi:hypothetical protein